VTGTSFDDLVTAATIGVARKGLDVSELAGPAAGQAGVLDRADPAAALLDAAALLTVARRAGLRPARDVIVPGSAAGPAAGRGAERELSARAARVLRRIGRTEVTPAFAGPDSELLADLLAAAADAGYVLPAPLLPGLLDAAVRREALRPAVAAVLGSRGRWLAARRPDWRRAVGQAGAGGDLETWRTGAADERRRFLAVLRRRDPAAGRELLAAGWARETGPDRAALIAVLRHGLSASDEEFLEAALDDRAGGVRDAARLLLERLPASALRQRAAGRAGPALRVERHGLRRPLVVVTLPGEPDAAAARDGLSAGSPVQAIGPGAWRLIEVLARAPLGDWTSRFGLTPAELVALPVAGDLRPHVHAGWRLAVVRQRGTGSHPDARELTGWIGALLSPAAGPPAGWPPVAWPGDAALAAVLPPRARAERAASLVARASVDDRGRDHELTAEVAACPVPWPPLLADAVAGLLARAAVRPVLGPLPRALLGLAGRGLPATAEPDYAAELARLATARPDWAALLDVTAETIALRRAFLAELR
jgi:Family of unknown function (DUF5691)